MLLTTFPGGLRGNSKMYRVCIPSHHLVANCLTLTPPKPFMLLPTPFSNKNIKVRITIDADVIRKFRLKGDAETMITTRIWMTAPQRIAP